jgi:hypothetical protein
MTVSDEMSDIGRALASGYGRDFNAANARLVRAGDDAADNDELSVALCCLLSPFSLACALVLTSFAPFSFRFFFFFCCLPFCVARSVDDMADQDDEMDDLVNELAALEVDPLKRFVSQFSIFLSLTVKKKKKKKKKKKSLAQFGFVGSESRHVWRLEHQL